MNRLEWTVAIIRVVAIWLFVQFALLVPTSLAGMLYFPEPEGQSTSVGYVALYLVLGLILPIVGIVVLWRASEFLARLIWRQSGDLPVQGPLRASDLQSALFATLGLYLIVVSIPDLTELAAGFYIRATAFRTETYYQGQLQARAAGVGFQIAVGVWILFGSQGLSSLVQKVRSAGTKTDT